MCMYNNYYYNIMHLLIIVVELCMCITVFLYIHGALWLVMVVCSMGKTGVSLTNVQEQHPAL